MLFSQKRSWRRDLDSSWRREWKRRGGMTSRSSRRCPLEGSYWPSELINTYVHRICVARDITLPKSFRYVFIAIIFFSRCFPFRRVVVQIGDFRDQASENNIHVNLNVQWLSEQTESPGIHNAKNLGANQPILITFYSYWFWNNVHLI